MKRDKLADEDRWVRHSALKAFGVLRDERAVASLVGKLRECGTSGTSFSHIRAVTKALGRIGSPAAAPALAEFLEQGHYGAHLRRIDALAGVPFQVGRDRHAALALPGMQRAGPRQGL